MFKDLRSWKYRRTAKFEICLPFSTQCFNFGTCFYNNFNKTKGLLKKSIFFLYKMILGPVIHEGGYWYKSFNIISKTVLDMKETHFDDENMFVCNLSFPEKFLFCKYQCGITLILTFKTLLLCCFLESYAKIC